MTTEKSATAISESKSFFDGFFELYEESFKKMNEALEGNIGQEFRLFDIRLNMSLSTRISLDSSYRYSGTDSAREVSRLTLKLSNIWFCYEALILACSSFGLSANSKSKVHALSEDIIYELISDYDFRDVLLDFWGNNGRLIKSHEKFHSDLQRFVLYLEQGATSKEQKKILLNIHNKFTNNDDFSVPEILALIYAIRNQYVHAGDTPKSGVSYYTTKISILRNANDFLVLFCLRLGTLIMDKKLAAVD